MLRPQPNTNLAMKIFPYTVWALCSMLVFRLLAAETYSLLGSRKYAIPWYSSNWQEQPVANLSFAFHESREYTTMNAIKSEIWRVREVRAGDAVFWTTLERKPI